MILAIGYSTEKTFNYFCSTARAEEIVDIDILDLSTIAKATNVSVKEEANNLLIIIDENTYIFKDYSGFYNRCYYSALGDSHREHALGKVISAVNSFLEATEMFVLNRHSSVGHNYNKFVHTSILKSFGFNTPNTFIAGDANFYLSISNTENEWINKSCSSVKTIAALVDEIHYTKLDLLSNCPSLFQARVVGFDVRIHLVGNTYFVEKIESTSIDYRFNDKKQNPNKYADIEVPKEVADLCIEFCQKERIYFTGIDFKVTNDNNWFILEVNPMPGYEGYDKRQNGKITNEILKLFKGMEKKHIDSNDYFFISNSRRPDIQAY